LAELLTGSNLGNETPASSCYDPSFSSLYFIRQNTVGGGEDNRNTAEVKSTK